MCDDVEVPRKQDQPLRAWATVTASTRAEAATASARARIDPFPGCTAHVHELGRAMDCVSWNGSANRTRAAPRAESVGP